MIAEDGGDGSLEDFSGVKLTSVMDKIYQKAAPGSDLNLAKDEIAMFKKCKTHDEIENCLRQVLLDRFRAYKKVCFLPLDLVKEYDISNILIGCSLFSYCH